MERMIAANASHAEIAAKLRRTLKAAYHRTHLIRKAKAPTTADAKIKQIFTAPMPQPQAKPTTLTPAQRTWAAPAKVKHNNAV